MTVAEYNELVESLHYGHELGFKYDGKEFFLEFMGDNTYEFYDVTDENNGILISKIIAKDMDELVSFFLSKPIINGKSFNEIYPFIDYVEID